METRKKKKISVQHENGSEDFALNQITYIDLNWGLTFWEGGLGWGGGWEVLYQSAMIPSHEFSEISHAAIDQTQICDRE